jgi:hypothetical protein
MDFSICAACGQPFAENETRHTGNAFTLGAGYRGVFHAACLAPVAPARPAEPIGMLLTKATHNPKLAKGVGLGIDARILHLSPGNKSGYEACPYRSLGCTMACLDTSGRGRMNAVQTARIRKTRALFERRDDFMTQLVRESESLVRHAAKYGLRPALRLNGTSDIGWSRFPVVRAGESFPHMFAAFPEVQFYDYTKVTPRLARKTLPSNYHLTFSLSECNDVDAQTALDLGFNVAAVLAVGKYGALPETWSGYPVIDGTTHDYRFLDPTGPVIVALRPKGKANVDLSGFVRSPDGKLDLSRTRVLAVQIAA